MISEKRNTEYSQTVNWIRCKLILPCREHQSCQSGEQGHQDMRIDSGLKWSLLPKRSFCQFGLKVLVVFHVRVRVTFVSWGHCILTSALDEAVHLGQALVSSTLKVVP